VSIEEYLAELKDADRPLVSSGLARLSNLPPNELVLLLEAWSCMDTGRRKDIVGGLVELAEENTSLNFDGIFLACLDDADDEVKVSAIEGLWEYESRSLIDPLIELLKGDSNESVRAAAATALGKFTLLAELGELPSRDGDRLERTRVEVIDNRTDRPEVRRRAVEAIAVFSTTEVSQIIREAYYSDDHKMRVSAIYAMGMNCDAQWLPILLEELGNPDAEIRFEAVVACGEMEEEQTVPRLVSLIDDPDSQVQMSAIAALGKIGGSEAENALRKCLERPDEHVRSAATEAVEELERSVDPFSFELE
jgi:HEAT repeat protein